MAPLVWYCELESPWGRTFLRSPSDLRRAPDLAVFFRVKDNTNSPVTASISSTSRTCLQSVTGESIISVPGGQRTSQRSSPFEETSRTSIVGLEDDLGLLTRLHRCGDCSVFGLIAPFDLLS
jgi:hypothetical protein